MTRLNLTQDVDLAVTDRKLILAIFQCTFLTEVERTLTDLFAINPNFVAKQREDDGTITVSFDLPPLVGYWKLHFSRRKK